MSAFTEPLAQARRYRPVVPIDAPCLMCEHDYCTCGTDRAEFDAALDLIEQRAADMEKALREIEELCGHWELHDKTDPDEHERWRLAAIRRAEMVGDLARAALDSADGKEPT